MGCNDRTAPLPYPGSRSTPPVVTEQRRKRNCEPVGALLSRSSQNESYAAPGEIGLWNTGSDFIGLS